MCRTNGTLGYVGMSAYVEEDMENLIFPDKVIRVREDITAYLWRILQLPHLRIQIEAAARTAVGNYAIGSDDIWSLHTSRPSTFNARHGGTLSRPAAAGYRAPPRRGRTCAPRRPAAEVEALILGTFHDRELS